MHHHELKYYEDIQILVDGWPWNVKESDFRKRDGVGRSSRMRETRKIANERQVAALFVAISGNRRAPGRDRRAGADRRRP